jgi:beta-ring hydroxylase
MVDEEDPQFHEEYMNEQDPSILHFLLASGDDVCNLLIKCLLIPQINANFLTAIYRFLASNSVMT